jgi:acyl carrier protein
MTDTLTEPAADALVRDVLTAIAPGPALDALSPDEDLRETLGLDSLDFLALVTKISERAGRRIDEDDYDRLADLAGWVAMLTSPATTP